VHAGRAARGRGSQNQPADEIGPDQRDLLRDEAADGEPEDIGPAEPHGGEERDGVVRHLLDGVRRGSGRTADPGVVERNHPPARCQRVDQRGIPVVQVSAKVLEQDQR
jgi:hypothetical protein